MRSLRFPLPLLAFSLLFLLSLSANAQDRSKFAIELRLGLSVPATGYIENKTVLIGEDSFPRIVDLTNRSSIINGVITGDIRDIEFSLAVRNFRWDQSIIHHKGGGIATESIDGEIDDTGVSYSKLDPSITTDEDLVASKYLTLYALTVGKRFYLTESNLFMAYIPAAGGLAWTDVVSSEDNNYGVVLSSGLASELFVHAHIAFTADVRFHALFTENAAGVSQGAQNASVTDANIFDALISSMYFVTCDLGVRVSWDQIREWWDDL